MQLSSKVNEQGAPVASLSATAHQLNITGGRGTVGCYRIAQQRQELEGTTQENNATLRVSQNNRTGVYNVNYNPGSGASSRNVSRDKQSRRHLE